VHGQQGRDLGDVVDLAPVGDVVDDALGVGLDPVADAGHLLGRERRRQQAPDLGVPGRVHGDEPLRGVEQLLRHRLEHDALAGQEVLVPHHRPEALVVGVLEQPVGDRPVPGDGPVAAQLGEGALALDGGGRPEVERGQVGLVVRALGPGDRGAGRRHGTSVRWACHGLSYT
jgi:hypothetical protein